MNSESMRLIERYIEWLKEKSTERDVGAGWTTLTFPFLDRHNDHLQVHVRQESQGLRITDEGRTIRDLKRIGCDLKARTKRRSLAEKILRGLGLTPNLLDSGTITTIAVNGDFPHKLHSTLMSMLALDGLAKVSPPNVAAMFEEDVTDWLVSIGAHFERSIKLTGRSGAPHEFDFSFPETPTQPARILHSITNPDRVHIQSFTYEVIDVRGKFAEDRLAGPEFYAALNDSESLSQKQYLALLAHQITPLPWSTRTQFEMRFKAPA